MQQSYVGSGQVDQQQQNGIPPASTAEQQQFGGQSQMLPPDQQQISNQSNTVQIPNQQYSQQQPIIISQAGKKKKKTGRKILNALIVALAIILIVGIIALTIMQCKKAREQCDAKNHTNEASKPNPNFTTVKGDLCTYTSQSVNNNATTNNLDTINQSQSQSASVGS